MIEWNESLELGISEIDDQHKKLIQTLEDIYDACSRGEGMKQLDQTIRFLEWYVIKHFADEEAIQLQYKYPQYEIHKKIHQGHIKAVRGIREDFKSDKYNTENLSRVITYLIHMIKQHIEHEDRLVADFLKQRESPQEIKIESIGRDYLTGLLSKEEFNKALAEKIKNQSLTDTRQIDYIVMKIDGFDQVNKSYGYDIGDEVIMYVSGILHSVINDELAVARLHRDEFVMFIAHNGGREFVTDLLENIKQQIYYGFQRKGSLIPLSMSMGVVSLTPDESDIKSIHQKATIALDTAKEKGFNQSIWFEESMYEQTKRKAKILNMLQPYNLSNYLKVVYQPIYNPQQQIISGAEALLRMFDIDGEMISPLEFIPLAEENNLMQEIGYFCIEQVCQMLQRFKQQGVALDYVSINLSVQQFQDINLVERILEYAREYGIEVSSLHFEIVESLLIDDFNKIKKILAELREHGCKILLDDFGTGYSSLSYLSEVSIDTVKIDRSFLKNINNSSKSQIILQTIIELVHKLGMKTVLEGVERTEELETIIRFGGDMIQGYLISKPVTEELLVELLQ